MSTLVLPFFRRVESDADFDNKWHGRDGPLPIRRDAPETLLPEHRAFLRACSALGYPPVADHNAPGAIGAGVWPRIGASLRGASGGGVERPSGLPGCAHLKEFRLQRGSRRLARTLPLSDVARQEWFPGPQTTDADADLESAIRTRVGTYFHPVGTCRMGPAADATAGGCQALTLHAFRTGVSRLFISTHHRGGPSRKAQSRQAREHRPAMH